MSRIGNAPITIPEGVEINISAENMVSVKGKLGELKEHVNPSIKVEYNDGIVSLSRSSNEKEIRSMHGLYRSLINNMVVGVEEGITKSLVINGVGYRASVGDGILTLQLGYSHDIKLAIPEDLEVKCTKPTEISISGIDKQKVGQFASEVRALRKPEPYNCKGIRYSDDVIRRKEGKKK